MSRNIQGEDTAQPVTMVITQQVKPGLEAAFEEWLHGIVQDAALFDGYMGVEIIRPGDHAHPEYVIIFRFSTFDHLKRWQTSDQRKQWLAKLEPLAAVAASQEIVTGLEYWFSPVQTPVPVRPPQYKQAAITWLAIYPLVTLLLILLTPVLGGLPLLVRTFILTILLVFLMTYVVMPRMTKLFAAWLFAG